KLERAKEPGRARRDGMRRHSSIRLPASTIGAMLPTDRLLTLAASKDERLAGDPTRLIGCEKYSGVSNVLRLGDAAEWRLGFHHFAEVAFGDSHSMEPLRFHHPRVQRIDPDLSGAELLRERDCQCVHRRLGCAVHRSLLDRHGTGDGADVD